MTTLPFLSAAVLALRADAVGLRLPPARRSGHYTLPFPTCTWAAGVVAAGDRFEAQHPRQRRHRWSAAKDADGVIEVLTNPEKTDQDHSVAEQQWPRAQYLLTYNIVFRVLDKQATSCWRRRRSR
jgi:LPS-assembly lipoprotein